MKKTFLVIGFTVALIGAVPFVATAARPSDAGRGVTNIGQRAPKTNKEVVEKVGQIEVAQNPQARGKFKNITLKVGSETYKLLPGRGNRHVMAELEKLVGHEVTVKGTLLPADSKHPMPAIIIQSFTDQSASQTASPTTSVTAVTTTSTTEKEK